jgi:hypothetical protein
MADSIPYWFPTQFQRSNPKSRTGGWGRLWHRAKVDSVIGLPLYSTCVGVDSGAAIIWGYNQLLGIGSNTPCLSLDSASGIDFSAHNPSKNDASVFYFSSVDAGRGSEIWWTLDGCEGIDGVTHRDPDEKSEVTVEFTVKISPVLPTLGNTFRPVRRKNSALLLKWLFEGCWKFCYLCLSFWEKYNISLICTEWK